MTTPTHPGAPTLLQSPRIGPTPPRCPFCETRSKQTFLKREPATEDPRNATLAGMTVDLVRCRECRGVFVRRDFPESLVNAFYEAHGGGYADLRVENMHWWMQNVGPAYQDVLDLAHPMPRGRWLDVGCGKGMMMLMARDAGWSVVGLEISDDLARFVRDHLHLPAVTGTLDEHEDRLTPQSFDVITLLDVLEHLYRPAEALRQCMALLRPGGLLVVKSPNGPMQLRKETVRHRLGRGSGNVATLGHLNQFTPESLTTLCRAAGLINIRVAPAMTFLPAVRGAEFNLRRSVEYVGKRLANATMTAVHRTTGANVGLNLLASGRKPT